MVERSSIKEVFKNKAWTEYDFLKAHITHTMLTERLENIRHTFQNGRPR